MAPKMSLYDSRQRAADAFDLRAKRMSWREVCDRLGFRSVGAAQTAVNRHVARMRRESSETSLASHTAALTLRTRALDSRFVAAFQRGDDDTMALLNREIRGNETELAKLGGMYAPQQVDMTVTTDPAAIIERARTELLAAIEQNPPIDAEVVE